MQSCTAFCAARKNRDRQQQLLIGQLATVENGPASCRKGAVTCRAAPLLTFAVAIVLILNATDRAGEAGQRAEASFGEIFKALLLIHLRDIDHGEVAESRESQEVLMPSKDIVQGFWGVLAHDRRLDGRTGRRRQPKSLAVRTQLLTDPPVFQRLRAPSLRVLCTLSAARSARNRRRLCFQRPAEAMIAGLGHASPPVEGR